MNRIYHFFVVLILAVIAAGCSFDSLTQVEPDKWQRREFESQVSKSVRRAVHTPGIDNGSTLIVSLDGDTLLVPADSALRAAPLRVVYVDIHSPEYPNTVSSKGLAIVSSVVSVILVVGLILVILIGVFIVVIRRQNGRNKIISSAIDAGYELPESFYTSKPKVPQINVTQMRESAGSPSDSAPSEETAPAVETGISVANDIVKSFTSSDKIKQRRTAFILIGLGVVVFISFASNHNEGVGFFVGGTLFVFGAAKLFTMYFSKKI